MNHLTLFRIRQPTRRQPHISKRLLCPQQIQARPSSRSRPCTKNSKSTIWHPPIKTSHPRICPLWGPSSPTLNYVAMETSKCSLLPREQDSHPLTRVEMLRDSQGYNLVHRGHHSGKWLLIWAHQGMG
jgi:hypothetical protein